MIANTAGRATSNKSPSPQKYIKYSKNNHFNRDCGKISNPISNEDEIIESYGASKDFWRKQEDFHKEADIWYWNHAVRSKRKSKEHGLKADICYKNYCAYLYLQAIAVVKKNRRST